MHINVLNILLIEDNPGDIRLLQEILREVTTVRCQITPAMTLAAAIGQLAQSDPAHFDIILLDLTLPDSHGLASIVDLQQQALQIPIVILTGLDDETTALAAMQQGAQDYIIKGQVDRHLLLRSIRYAIERERAETDLRTAKIELERRVIERTQDLQQINRQLQLELIERQKAEAALYVAQENLHDALQKLNFHFENSPLAAIEWDREFRVTRWSATAEKIFGWSSAQVLGRKLGEWQFVVPEDVERIGTVMKLFTSGTETSNITINSNYCQDGTIVNCEWYNSVLLDDHQQMESVFSLALDVTNRHQIERMKDEFISVVSHELRTPMTSIYGSLQMLSSGLLQQEPEKERRLLTIAVDSTNRLMRLVNDILDIERIESGTVQMVKSVWKVADLMAKAVDEIEPLAGQAGIKINTSDTGGNVWVDADRMIQAFTNLLGNAIKFSPKDSQIWFTAKKQAGQMLFQVRDQGRGIPPGKLEIIFERFQQVDASDARNSEGTGLGLAISRSLIQQHGGQIWAESVVGAGSTFSFILPRSPSASDSLPPNRGTTSTAPPAHRDK